MVMEIKQLSDTKVQQRKETETPVIKEPMACGSVEILAEPKGSGIQKSSSSLVKKLSKYLR